MDTSRKSRRSAAAGSSFVFVACALLGALLGVRMHGRKPVLEARVVPALRPGPAGPSASPTHSYRSFGKRLGVAAAFATLFVAGGSLAAWGGNEAGQLAEVAHASATADPIAESTPATTDPAATETTVAPVLPDETAADAPAPAPADVPAEAVPVPAPAAVEPADALDPASAPAVTAAVVAAAAPSVPRPSTTASAPVARRTGTRPRTTSAVAKKAAVPVAPAPDPEATAPATASMIWLNDAPDPTPAGRPLTRTFVHQLVRAAGHDWPLELALLRVQLGERKVPSRTAVLSLAGRLPAASQRGEDWSTALALTGASATADRAVALAHYYRAVGTETLVTGLLASRARLSRRLLGDPRVTLTDQGRADIEAGRVNERVLAVIGYLADTFGSVEVSSLISGHRLYARPRVISAHVFGEAVDVAALGGVSIAGHQEEGGLTEQAVRDLLYLPADVEPHQIISLLGLGGPSFALADHTDHIHIGF